MKRKKYGGRDFQIGNCANPLGAKAHSPIKKALKGITNENLKELAEILLENNVQALSDVEKNPQSTVLKIWIARAAQRGIEEGDLASLETILNRILGRPKQAMEISGAEGNPIQVQDVTVPLEDRIKLLKGIK